MGSNHFSAQNYFDFSDFEHRALFDNIEYVWQVLGKIGSYLENKKTWNIRGTVHEGAYLVGSCIEIEEGAEVEPGAYIKGPAVIGAGTQVRQGAYIRGNVIAGKNCVIGHATEVKNAVFLNNAKAGHFAYVGDSVLGGSCNLGAGTKLANLKVIDSFITIRHKGITYDTGLRKFGAILGDNVETGCNSVTMPGTILGKACVCYPNTNVRGVIEADMILRMKSRLESFARRS
jgi:NDP-sugar pyrophosphorylase family protein